MSRGRAARWSLLTLAALAMVATLPGRTQGLGLVTEPLIAAFEIDRVTYAGINLWATLLGASFAIPCGWLLDRLGPRVVLTALLVALGGTVMAMSRATELAALAVAVTLTRGLGQSALSVASLALVGKAFASRLSSTMGIYSVLVGIGFVAAFPSVGQAVLAFGWRDAWLAVGLLVFLLAPLAWLVVRGEFARGEEPPGRPTPETHDDLTVWRALRSPAFWVFALSSSLFGLVYSGIALFNQSILEERGFGATVYHETLVISTIVGLATNFAGGYLATRWPIQRVMAIGMGVLALALTALPSVATHAHVLLYGMAMGAAGGVVTVVFFSVWGQVFGKRHLGGIQGVAQTMTVVASAIGPLLLARTLARTGSYGSIFYILAGLAALSGIACLAIALPTRPFDHIQPLRQK